MHGWGARLEWPIYCDQRQPSIRYCNRSNHFSAAVDGPVQGAEPLPPRMTGFGICGWPSPERECLIPAFKSRSGSGNKSPLLAANNRSNAALGTVTATILAITSNQQADKNPPEQLITSATIRNGLEVSRNSPLRNPPECAFFAAIGTITEAPSCATAPVRISSICLAVWVCNTRRFEATQRWGSLVKMYTGSHATLSCC